MSYWCNMSIRSTSMYSCSHEIIRYSCKNINKFHYCTEPQRWWQRAVECRAVASRTPFCGLRRRENLCTFQHTDITKYCTHGTWPLTQQHRKILHSWNVTIKPNNITKYCTHGTWPLTQQHRKILHSWNVTINPTTSLNTALMNIHEMRLRWMPNWPVPSSAISAF